MKNLFLALLMVAFFAGCTGKSASTDNTAGNAAVANTTKTFVIDGMTCEGCENTIKEAVTKIAGVTDVKASFVDSTAVISFDSTQTSVVAIADAVTEAGYVFNGEKTPLK